MILRRWSLAALPLLLLLQSAPSATSFDDLAGLFCDVGPDALSSVPAPRTCIDFNSGGRGGTATERRCWYTYTPPPAAPAEVAVPLVLDLHGVLSCASRSAGYTGWRDLAIRDSFALVWPMGIDDSSLALPVPCWNAGGCCCFDRSNVLGNDDEERVVDVPDVPFLAQVVADTVASSTVPIDTGRIYLAGHSNGCMMAQRLAAEMSGLIAAVCCHSGVAAFDLDAVVANANDNASAYGEYVPTPVMTIHGDGDTTVPYDGGGFMGSFLGAPSAEANAASWAAINGCDPVPSIVEDVTGSFATHTYGGCRGGTSVQLVQVYDVGHFPYRDRNEFFEDNFGQTDIDTTRLAKEFCFRYGRDGVEVAQRLPPCTGCAAPAPSSPTAVPTAREPTAVEPTTPVNEPDDAPERDNAPERDGAAAGADVVVPSGAEDISSVETSFGGSSMNNEEGVATSAASVSLISRAIAPSTCMIVIMTLIF